MVPKIRDLSMTQWISDAAEFFAEVRTQIAASEALKA